MRVTGIGMGNAIRSRNPLHVIVLVFVVAMTLAGCGGGGTPVSTKPPQIPILPDDHSDTRSNATALAIGGSEPGEIETAGDDDYFRMNVTASGTLTVYSAGNINTVGELQDSSGTVLASDDDGGTDTNFRIEHDVGPGTYFVKVGGFGAATGNYVVHSSFAPKSVPPTNRSDEADTPGGASTIVAGQHVTGYFDSPGDVDYFRLPLSGPSLVTLEIDVPLGTEVTVLDENGRVLATHIIGQATGSGAGPIALSASVQPHPQVAVALPAILAAGKWITIRIAAIAANKVAIQRALYVLHATAAVITSRQIIIFVNDINLTVDAGADLTQNLFPYLECRFRDGFVKIEGCEFEFEVTGFVSIGANPSGIPIGASIRGGVLYVNAPCETKNETFEVSFSASAEIGDETIAESGKLKVTVQDSEDCDDELRAGAYLFANNPVDVEQPGIFVSVGLPTFEENKAEVTLRCSERRGSSSCSGALPLFEGQCVAEAVGEHFISGSNSKLVYFPGYSGTFLSHGTPDFRNGSARKAEEFALHTCWTGSSPGSVNCWLHLNGICGFGYWADG